MLCSVIERLEKCSIGLEILKSALNKAGLYGTIYQLKTNFSSIKVGNVMNYNKLWKLLIDKGMMKKDLQEKAGITSNVIAKMGKGGDVSTQVLRKICEVLDCRMEDICEFDN